MLVSSFALFLASAAFLAPSCWAFLFVGERSIEIKDLERGLTHKELAVMNDRDSGHILYHCSDLRWLVEFGVFLRFGTAQPGEGAEHKQYIL